ncbi:MAG: hypothetical protein KGV46_02300 [Pasteurella sp.]|nr:hypothetical protein [Pasteurella sp.]
MNNTFTIDNKNISYQTVSGKVLSTEKVTEKEILGNTVRTNTNYRVWLQTDDGEQDFLFYDFKRSVRNGHDVTIILLSGNQRDYCPAALINNSTGSTHWSKYSVKLYDGIGLDHKAKYSRIWNSAFVPLILLTLSPAVRRLILCFVSVPAAVALVVSVITLSFFVFSGSSIGFALFLIGIATYIYFARKPFKRISEVQAMTEELQQNIEKISKNISQKG